MSEYINIPNVSVVIILIVFGMFVWQAYKVRLLYKLLEKATNSDDTLNALKETKIASIAESYAETICIDITSIQGRFPKDPIQPKCLLRCPTV